MDIYLFFIVIKFASGLIDFVVGFPLYATPVLSAHSPQIFEMKEVVEGVRSRGFWGPADQWLEHRMRVCPLGLIQLQMPGTSPTATGSKFQCIRTVICTSLRFQVIQGHKHLRTTGFFEKTKSPPLSILWLTQAYTRTCSRHMTTHKNKQEAGRSLKIESLPLQVSGCTTVKRII